MADLFTPAPAVLTPEYIPSWTAEEFMLAVLAGPVDELRLVILDGPRGEGKTSCGLQTCLALAGRVAGELGEWALPLRVAVIRDTFENIKRTTHVSFRENAQRGVPMVWSEQDHECVALFDGQPYVHFFFFGLDTLQDTDKLQGFQCGVLWLEEVAPAAEFSAGIPREALGLGGTSLRQPGVPKRILITMNPPDDDHWIVGVEEHLIALGIEEIRVGRFTMEQGEKSEHFRWLAQHAATPDAAIGWQQAAREFDVYRKANEALLGAIGRQDLVDRLVKGQRGGVQVGQPLTPEFKRRLHTTTDWMRPIPGLPIVRCWDGGRTPSCVMYQPESNGNINVFGSMMGRDMSMSEFIRDIVLPFQRKYGIEKPRPITAPGGAKPGYKFRDIGDPALGHDNQAVQSQETARWVIEEMLQTSVEYGIQAWDSRRQALKTALHRDGHGDRKLVQIYAPECKTLIAAMAGRARYPKDAKTGRVLDSVASLKKMSGDWFQELDAFAYGLTMTHPAEEWLRQRLSAPVPATPLTTRQAHSWMGR